METPTPPPRKNDWRVGALIGTAIGVAMMAVKLTEKLLGPHLGEWPAFGIGLVIAALLAMILGLLGTRTLLRR